MGAITSKDITHVDECFARFLKHLIEKYDYQMVKYKPTEHDIFSFIDQEGVTDKTVIKFGDAYIFHAAKETLEQMKANSCLSEPFFEQICDSPGTLDFSGVKDLLDERVESYSSNTIQLFCIAYPQLNWCKMIATAIVKLDKNPIYDTPEAHMKVLCAMRPKIKVPNATRKEILAKSKIGMGAFLTIYVANWLKRKGYTYIKGECARDLWPYYSSLGNQIGPSIHISYFDPKSKHKGSYHQDVDRVRDVYDPDVNRIIESLGLDWKRNKLLIKQHVLAYDYIEDQFNIHLPLDDLDKLKSTCMDFTPNIIDIFNTQYIFDTSSDQHSLTTLIGKRRCIDRYFEQK